MPSGIDAAFAKYDTDGDGALSRQELMGALRALSLSFTAAEVSSMMSLCGTGADGGGASTKLDINEFKELFGYVKPKVANPELADDLPWRCTNRSCNSHNFGEKMNPQVAICPWCQTPRREEGAAVPPPPNPNGPGHWWCGVWEDGEWVRGDSRCKFAGNPDSAHFCEICGTARPT